MDEAVSNRAAISATAGLWSRRAQRPFWTAIWLVFLIGPALTLPDLDPVAPAVVGLTAFVVAYLVVMWSCWDIRPTPTASQLVGLTLVAGLGVALFAAYGAQNASWQLVLIYVGAAGVASLSDRRIARAWLAATVAVFLVVGTSHGVPIADLALMALVIALVGTLNVTFRRTQELISHLQKTQAELAETAVAAERLRFSRDLHDLLGHTLSVIVVKAEVAKRSASQDSATAEREAGEIEQIGRRALAEVREAVTGLGERTVAAELDAARTALADAGVAVTVQTSGTPLPGPADSLLGWAVREAATNVLRHSEAQHCDIEIRRANGMATLEVRNDGVPRTLEGRQPEPIATGRGLSGLADRLADAGGELAADGSEDGEWRLTATVAVPVAATDRSGSDD